MQDVFPSIRHNEIRDLTACWRLLRFAMMCWLSLTYKTITCTFEFHLDYSGCCLPRYSKWFLAGCFERTYFDICVFNPLAPSNRKSQPLLLKTWEYERVREIEHAYFIPLILSVTVGLANEATILYKRLASLFFTTMGWLRCQLSYICHSML